MKKRHCPHCGVKILEELSNFCHDCGLEIKHATRKISQAIHKYHIGRDLIFLLLGILLIYGLYNIYEGLTQDINVNVPEQTPLVINQQQNEKIIERLIEKEDTGLRGIGNIQEWFLGDFPEKRHREYIPLNPPPVAQPARVSQEHAITIDISRNTATITPKELTVHIGDTVLITSTTNKVLSLSIYGSLPDNGYSYGIKRRIMTLSPQQTLSLTITTPTNIRIRNHENGELTINLE